MISNLINNLFNFQVIGITNIASMDAKSNVVIDTLDYQSPQSRIFRIALILSIFAVVGKEPESIV